MAKTKNNQPKKVTLKHLSEKHKVDMKSLRMMLTEAGLIKKGARKVEKKKAKAVIRDYFKGSTNGVLQDIAGVSWAELFTYFALGLLATVSFIGLVNKFNTLDKQAPSSDSTRTEIVKEDGRENQDVDEEIVDVDDIANNDNENDHSSAFELPVELPKTGS